MIKSILFLPRNLAISLLKGYRFLISPLYGQVCRYYPSCSAYALEAVTLHGVIKGGAMSAWRILRCNPWSAGGVDDVPGHAQIHPHVDKFGFVHAHSSAEG